MKRIVLFVGLCILVIGCSNSVKYDEITFNETLLNQTVTEENISYINDSFWNINLSYLTLRKPTISINCFNISNESLDIYTEEGLWEVISHDELCERILRE